MLISSQKSDQLNFFTNDGYKKVLRQVVISNYEALIMFFFSAIIFFMSVEPINNVAPNLKS